VKAIILAGGKGSRLMPLTKICNKHMIPVGSKPMIEHTLEKIAEGRYIKEVCIVTSPQHAGQFIEYFEDGSKWGLDITYKMQVPKNNGGIAEALGICRSFVGDEKMVVFLGDNLFKCSFNFKVYDEIPGARVFLKDVLDPERFGVAQLRKDWNGENVIVDIIEKPKNPKSKFAVTGLYIYDSKVWDYIDNCEYSERGELEITDVNNMYLKDNNLSNTIVPGAWMDCGTLKSLEKANKLIYEGEL